MKHNQCKFFQNFIVGNMAYLIKYDLFKIMWEKAENWIINVDNFKFIEPFTIDEYEEALRVWSSVEDPVLNAHAKLNKDMNL